MIVEFWLIEIREHHILATRVGYGGTSSGLFGTI